MIFLTLIFLLLDTITTTKCISKTNNKMRSEIPPCWNELSEAFLCCNTGTKICSSVMLPGDPEFRDPEQWTPAERQGARGGWSHDPAGMGDRLRAGTSPKLTWKRNTGRFIWIFFFKDFLFKMQHFIHCFFNSTSAYNSTFEWLNEICSIFIQCWPICNLSGLDKLHKQFLSDLSKISCHFQAKFPFGRHKIIILHANEITQKINQ